MDDKKEKKGFWKNWMTIAVLTMLTIMVLLFNSQNPSIRSEKNENISIGNGTNIVDKGTNTTDNSTIIMDNDTFFKISVKVNLAVILADLNCITEAGQNRNFNATERCGKFLSENSNVSLRHVSEYNVSPSLHVALEKYKNALEYYNIGGAKLEIGARNRNLSQMEDAIEYIQNGTAYINIFTEVLYANDTSNKSTTIIYPKVNESR